MIGVLYDGNRKRLAGNGPKTFNSALDAKLCFKSMLHLQSCNFKEGSRLQSDDRLWALPERFDITQIGMSNILFDLANIIKAGHRVGLASSSKMSIETSRDAIVIILQKLSVSS